MKIYTRQGDDGQTSQLGDARVPKDHPRIEACGTVDELCASLAMAEHSGLCPAAKEIVRRVQNELFSLGAQLSHPAGTPARGIGVSDSQIASFEDDIDRLDEQLPPLTQFILPSGSRGAAALHLARAVGRRAERRVVALRQSSAAPEIAIRYLNRLSDLLFVLARYQCAKDGADDVPWRQS